MELLSTMPQVKLQGGFLVRFEAIDPSSGAAVTGVTVSNVSLYGETPAGETVPVLIAPTEPGWIPLPVEALNGAGGAG